ncbi:hypothetical protein AA0120_g12582 [Alternaria tenuissima]|nr:hypothetical protein AA0120_g12582 [Alternaria tenuissima]
MFTGVLVCSNSEGSGDFEKKEQKQERKKEQKKKKKKTILTRHRLSIC